MNIPNLGIYNDNMRKSLLDKAFFLPYVDSETFVDFGCADGSLIKYIRTICPNSKCVGYDSSEKMLDLARQNLSDDPNVIFTSNWDLIKSRDWCDPSCVPNMTLILSSVIHEVYSYGSELDIQQFWINVFSSNFEHIVIRDLMPRRSCDRPSEINDIIQAHSPVFLDQLTEFESIWGSVENNKNLLHFLMKYKWKENWKREVRENYFPIYIEELFTKISTQNFRVTFFDTFTPALTLEGIRNDFGIELKDTTHIKLILRNTGED